MMTFEKSGAILEDGRLTADDGTTLEVHGISASCPELPGVPTVLLREANNQ